MVHRLCVDCFMQIAQKSWEKNGFKCFSELLLMAENLRSELTSQRDRCVPHEARHA